MKFSCPIKLNQRGVIHFLLPLILILGLIAAMYLITSGNPLKIFSKAGGGFLAFVNQDGSKCFPFGVTCTTTSANLKIELYSTLGPPASTVPSAPCLTLAGLIKAFGSIIGSIKGKSSNYDPSYDADNNGYINITDFSILKASKLFSDKCGSYPSAAISAPVKNTTRYYRLAEDPTDLDRTPWLPYTAEPTVVYYTLKNASAGQKFIWVEFQAIDDRADRKSAAITLVSPSVTAPFSMTVQVLSLKYFPLDPHNSFRVNADIVGFGSSLADLRSKVDDLTNQGLYYLTEATRHHGYNNPQAPAALRYKWLDSKEFLKPVPKSNFRAWNNPTFRPDYKKMLTEDINICDYVDNRGVKQVWIWGYHHGDIEPDESNMSMGRMSRSFWNHGSYGDISNSQQIDDLPVCNKTYVLYNYNYNTGLGEIIHDHGHQIEREMQFADNNLWRKFILPVGQDVVNRYVVNHCGTIHNPPNNSSGYGTNPLCTDIDKCSYNYISETKAQSDCEDWKPDGGGQAIYISCHNWSCDDNTKFKYYIWWMQNIPGLDNKLTYNGQKLKNWWEFYGDFDYALIRGRSLIFR